MTPPMSDTLRGAKMISTKEQHTCALMNNGDVRCWGGNSQGQLGDGTTIDRSTPTCVKWEESK